jgi:hypothetical protein
MPTNQIPAVALPPILAMLDPNFAERVQAIMNALQDRGLVSWIVSGLRTPEEQARIYAVGRGEPGKPFSISGLTVTAPLKSEHPEWSIITKAPPFMSAHQWGLAVDFGWIINGKKVFDTPDQNVWKTLYAIAQTQNSEDIAKSVPFDKAHIQSKAWHSIQANIEKYKQIYLQSGIAAVYTMLESQTVV